MVEVRRRRGKIWDIFSLQSHTQSLNIINKILKREKNSTSNKRFSYLKVFRAFKNLIFLCFFEGGEGRRGEIKKNHDEKLWKSKSSHRGWKCVCVWEEGEEVRERSCCCSPELPSSKQSSDSCAWTWQRQRSLAWLCGRILFLWGNTKCFKLKKNIALSLWCIKA